MTIDIFDVIEWTKCYFILYSEDKNNGQEIHYYKPIVFKPGKSNSEHNFYSVHSSKFGILVSDQATHWAICLMDDLRNEILYEGIIPGSYEYSILPISETKEIFLQKYNKYLRFTVGTKLSIRSSAKIHSRFKNVSSTS